jgi:DNA polymerase-3 subunit alpha
MGKKQKDVLDKMKPKFIAQSRRSFGRKTRKKFGKIWEALAEYVLINRIPTCYA